MIYNVLRCCFLLINMKTIKELTEGMCNVTYYILFHDGSESILKIASKDKKGNLTNEMNLMQAEVTAMKIVEENCSFKVADVSIMI